jgi:hypothetical protein
MRRLRRASLPPTTSRGGKQEHDATCNRRPAHHDPKELLLDVTERREARMEWCEGHRYDKHPEEYSGNDKGYSKIFLTNT